MIFLIYFYAYHAAFSKCMEIDPVTRRDDIVGSFKHESMIHELFRLTIFNSWLYLKSEKKNISSISI